MKSKSKAKNHSKAKTDSNSEHQKQIKKTKTLLKDAADMLAQSEINDEDILDKVSRF